MLHLGAAPHLLLPVWLLTLVSEEDNMIAYGVYKLQVMNFFLKYKKWQIDNYLIRTGQGMWLRFSIIVSAKKNPYRAPLGWEDNIAYRKEGRSQMKCYPKNICIKSQRQHHISDKEVNKRGKETKGK